MINCYYFHCGLDFFYVDTIGKNKGNKQVIKVGLCFEPSVEELKYMVKKHKPFLYQYTKHHYFYYRRQYKDFNSLPF